MFLSVATLYQAAEDQLVDASGDEQPVHLELFPSAIATILLPQVRPLEDRLAHAPLGGNSHSAPAPISNAARTLKEALLKNK